MPVLSALALLAPVVPHSGCWVLPGLRHSATELASSTVCTHRQTHTCFKKKSSGEEGKGIEVNARVFYNLKSCGTYIQNLLCVRTLLTATPPGCCGGIKSGSSYLCKSKLTGTTSSILSLAIILAACIACRSRYFSR